MMNPNQDTIDQLTDVRLTLSSIIESKKVGNQEFETFEIGYRANLQLAFMWLGKSKGVLNAEYPYPDSVDPTNKKIAPPQDIATKDMLMNFDYDDVIAYVKEVRNRMSVIEQQFMTLFNTLEKNRSFQRTLDFAYKHLCEAKFTLGTFLGYLKKKEEVEKSIVAMKKSLGGKRADVTKKEEALKTAKKSKDKELIDQAQDDYNEAVGDEMITKKELNELEEEWGLEITE